MVVTEYIDFVLFCTLILKLAQKHHNYITKILLGLQIFYGRNSEDFNINIYFSQVAAVSGDARRALDICRKATEIAEDKANSGSDKVTMMDINAAVEQMFCSPKIMAIR